MKKIGLIGGMSWTSTLEYYRTINEMVQNRYGGARSAKIGIESLDFSEIIHFQKLNNWPGAAQGLKRAATVLQEGGADMILICTNTMHKTIDFIEKQVKIPIFHIADCVTKAINKKGYKKVGLLGTRFTMEEDFIKSKMENQGLEIIIPNSEDRCFIHKVIFEELTLGIISETSKKIFTEIIGKLRADGAECVILGCTEIRLLIQQQDSCLPVFDTVHEHCREAVDFALG